jgi:putative endonuclease
MAQHNLTGQTGEALAVAYLQKQGYTVLHTGWKYGRSEVDIICSKAETLHFVEVKTKAGKGLGTPEQRVNAAKIGRMKRVAEHYLDLHPQWKFIQLDVLAITMQDGGQEEYFFIEDVY